MVTMEGFTRDMFSRIMESTEEMVKKDQKKTLTERDIEAGVRLVLNGELAKHACAEGQKAILKTKK